MNPLLLVNSQSLKRAKVIVEHTDSIKSGIIKAAMIAELKDKLNKGIAHFIFIKKNGEVREAWGTTSPSFVEKYINGRGVSREVYNTTAFFDIEKCSWKSLRWESIEKVY
jgi:predicted metal-dependent peptidase